MHEHNLLTMHPDLYPYQRVGAEFLAQRSFALLADPMGVGKTPQAIAACDLLDARRVLVVCPAIARETWSREWERWQTVDRSIAVARSGADFRNTKILKADVLVTSYSLLGHSRVALQQLLTRQNDVLVLDEAHNVKTPSAVRTKAVYGARLDRKGVAGVSERVWLLTGTPMPNHAGEVYTHLKALAPNGVPPRHQDFLQRYCVIEETDWGPKVKGNRADTMPELAAILKPHTLRRRHQDVQSELPPLRWGRVVVEPDKLPPREKVTKEEKQVVEAILAKIVGGNDPSAIIAAEAMHLASLRRWTGIAKAQAVAELLYEELDGGLDKVVVFAIHREVIQTIVSWIPWAAVALHGDTPQRQRQSIIDAFQSDGGPRVLICQLTIASTALTLTAAANVIFAETSWTPADLAQAAKRCHRIGQDRPVLARVVSLKGSIDDIVSATLIRKAKHISDFELAVTMPAVA